MNILVVGGGGREHALVSALAKSRHVKKIFCAPGNAGISALAECVPIQATDIPALVTFAKEKQIDLTMVGPEAPLVAGISDHFRREGLSIVGATSAAARLEGSKSFAKSFMQKYGIPTARYDIVPNLTKALYQLTHWKGRSVVKADGLAAGKGVKVCENADEAKDFLFELMQKEVFGEAGSTAVIEECLDGPEMTVMAFCDGKKLVAMPASQDHKRLLDGDQGPNTGGMGAYAPTPLLTPALEQEIREKVFEPFLRGVKAENFDFRGIIYFGLMITKDGPKVLEFNVRFGDPETQVVLPLLESDFFSILDSVSRGELDESLVRWKKHNAFTVVLASGGYPGSIQKGLPITGLEKAAALEDVQIFHAGTERKQNAVVTAGGRVINVTATAPSLRDARDRAYKAISSIRFDGMIYRNDIGAKALQSEAASARS